MNDKYFEVRKEKNLNGRTYRTRWEASFMIPEEEIESSKNLLQQIKICKIRALEDLRSKIGKAIEEIKKEK